MNCKKLLVVRPDNMGDLIMSIPAIRALKETFGCSITLLTSSMAAGIAPFIPGIDDTIVFDTPWVKNDGQGNVQELYSVIDQIRQQAFDGAVIFTVFSQNPLPSAMIAYMAGIPRRLAYCRENPYHLLTYWVPDKEPYSFVQHQVERDLKLVQTIGATTKNKKLDLHLQKNGWPDVIKKLVSIGADVQKPWLILHAGVSEQKREYPKDLWIETGKKIVDGFGYQLLLTGSGAEREIVEELKAGIGYHAFNTAGLFSLEEFITLIKQSPLVVSVNTSTIHIAAAVETPVIVLYALSNPQHAPWMAEGKVLLYDIPQELKSKNEVLRFVDRYLHPKNVPMVMPDDIIQAIQEVLANRDCFIPPMIPLQVSEQVL